MLDQVKIWVYLIIGAITIITNLSFVIGIIVFVRLELKALRKKTDLLTDENGDIRFQSKDSCADCRKTCRDDICESVSKDMDAIKDSMSRDMKTAQGSMDRLEKNFLRFHERLDKVDESITKIYVWMPERNK